MDKTYPLDFLLYIPLKALRNEFNLLNEPLSISKLKDNDKTILYFPSVTKFKIIEQGDNIFGCCGDPIDFNEPTLVNHLNAEFDVKNFLMNHPGHYYLFYFCKKQGSLIISSALFGMFPVFYYKNDEHVIISSRIQLILDFIPSLKEINKRFIVEQLLFNYPLFNETIIKDVKLFPSDHYLKIEKGKIDFIKHTDITKLFVDKPIKWKDTSDDLTTLFIERFKDYTVPEKMMISFTGGFDGRTLVACAKYFNQDFSTYSVGSNNNSDIYVPKNNSRKLGIEYTPYFLDTTEYIENDFHATGKELIHLTSCMSNYIYVHFLNSAKKFSNKYNYLYTGYFGSELFRALHLTGAVNSTELVTFFKENEKDKWINYLMNSPKLKFIRKEIFKNELEEIIEDLRKFKKDKLDNFPTLNKFFYKYVLEEVFRKVFGPHIFSQSNYINVRTPFLDIKFMEELFKSEVSGVNNDFFTHNPLKRIKGQLLYGKIISKTYPALAAIKTQKGYSPKDLLTLKGNINILVPYFTKKLKRKVEKPFLDNLGIISGLKHNWARMNDEIGQNNFYNLSALNTAAGNLDRIPEYERDILAFAVSSSLFINHNSLNS